MHNAIIKPQWSPVTIALMVLGFIIFWPLGLAMLAYILWGEYFGGSSEKAERWISKQKDWARDRRYRHRGYQASGNAAFDDYRSEQLKRLEEERKRLDEDMREFQDYMHNLRKARDREEFDRFMRDRRAPSDAERPQDHPHEYRQGY
ncbi:MAG: DUF2852 domain-containing protein [Alphaproteobacteria bacterium]|nr:DUF2852 domain-containing protein [Alphaproteobacteria bacterium]